MTKKQMQDQVVNWLGLQDITSFDETAMVSDLFQQGTIDLLSRTRCVVRCVQLRVRKDQDEYTLDHSLLGLVDIENGAIPKLRRGQTADYWYTGYPIPTVIWRQGVPLPYGFSLIRADVLRISPAPDEDGQIQVWGVLRPQKMDEDTDSPGMEEYGAIPDEYHDAIVTYAMWKAADYTDDQGSGQGERYRILYEGQDGRGGRLGQIRTLVNKRGTARGTPRRVKLRPVSSSGSYIG